MYIQRVKAEDNGYVINFEVESDDAIQDATPFAELMDTESYTKELRHSPPSLLNI